MPLEFQVNELLRKANNEGDYVLGLMNEMYHCKGKPYAISLVNTCNELNAAYAADGYARIRGFITHLC